MAGRIHRSQGPEAPERAFLAVSLTVNGVKYRLSGKDARGREQEPLVEVAVVDSLGVSHTFKAGKDGTVEVDEDFQEVAARLADAGFEPYEPQGKD